MEHQKIKQRGATATPQPALVSDQAPAGLDPSGFDQAQTLAEIEAIRSASYAAVAADYYAAPGDMKRLLAATYAREDIDRAADKARDRIVNRALANLGRKAA